MTGPHALLEPEVAAVAGSLEQQNDLLPALLSIAISLKRLADDHRAAPERGGALARADTPIPGIGIDRRDP